MRILMKISIPTEVGNAMLLNGTLATKLKEILDDIKPEAAFFIEENGKRCPIIVANLQDESSIPALVEPFFLAFGASVECHPAMVLDDLMKAGTAMEKVAKKYGPASLAHSN